ncbi:MAG: 2-C-methyl-D-erythritol 4-phosphate cytidylyltransferase [Firmicutes bacterium]|nr:2-C-methyl-D-erythritol 4-phosphate cytidylyltransferase [Bacillota bacterium]
MGSITAIIAAAGQGKRMGVGRNKQYLSLIGQPILARTLAVFQSSPLIDDLVVVVARGEVDYCVREIVQKYRFFKVSRVIAGGKERQDSVFEGLRHLQDDCSLVVVHDGARPLLTPVILSRVIQQAELDGAAVAAVPVKDTIKVVDEDGLVVTTPGRKQLWAIQTPQVFRRDILQSAYEQAYRDGFWGTDDASLVERLGLPVRVVMSSYDNLKITTPDDLILAETIWQRRTD